MQVGTAEDKDISKEECLKIISKSSPVMAESLRSMNARLAAARHEVLKNPDMVPGAASPPLLVVESESLDLVLDARAREVTA